ncbi:glutamine amidotransferase [Humibacter albus]|uniref:glutamine amidotransferase n=1 Tax=Humibacter albus TaxID=427754 RepID=UPI0003B5A3B2|nr:glutamine amidotransferase [Humibacter albus]
MNDATDENARKAGPSSGGTIRILQLYPDELGVTGDAGNVDVLRIRLERSGHTVAIETHRPGASLGTEPDLVVIGNGPLSALRRVLPDALRHRLTIAEWAQRVPFFAVGAGLELLCARIHDSSGDLDGLGVLGAEAHRGRRRRVGYAIAETDEGTITGFEDQATELTGVQTRFATIVRDVTGPASRPDGVRTSTIIGTLLQGPLLPLNPLLADHLAGAAARHAGITYVPDASLAHYDRLAAHATERMRSHVASVFTTIQ